MFCVLTNSVLSVSYIVMKTIAIGQVQSGVGVERREKSLVRSVFAWFAWVWDRFVFHIIYRGERLRPEVREELRKSVEEVKQGKDTSPGFTNVDDAIRWLDSQEV